MLDRILSLMSPVFGSNFVCIGPLRLCCHLHLLIIIVAQRCCTIMTRLPPSVEKTQAQNPALQMSQSHVKTGPRGLQIKDLCFVYPALGPACENTRKKQLVN